MTPEPLIFIVPQDLDGCRLDRALAVLAAEKGLSREQCKKHIQEGGVLLNQKIQTSPKSQVAEGDHLSLSLPKLPSELVPEQGSLEIIYCDEHLLVINKPAGLTVHPCPSCPQGTLVHRLIHHFPDLEGDGPRPGIVHRLDKDTSGLLLIARTEKCRLRLAEQFAGREVTKAYAALVHGLPRPPQGEINAPLARHPTNKTRMAVQTGGREAITRYATAWADRRGRFALLNVHILTGRTHQIRVHLSHLGHPLWGDKAYGGKTHLPPCENKHTASATLADATPATFASNRALPKPGNTPESLIASRQMLHAYHLAFRHPESSEALSFNLPPPPDFCAALVKLLAEPLRLVITGLPGCGKSALLEALAAHNLPVFSADAAVDKLYAPDGPGWDLLNRRFNRQFTPPGQPVDRRALGAAMRADEALRREVEHLVHPLVKDALDAFWEHKLCAPALAAEIPLYFEAGWGQQYKETAPPHGADVTASLPPKDPRLEYGGRPLPARHDVPIIVTVCCSEELRLARLAQRGVAPEAARAMTAWQWSEEAKIKAGHLALLNDGSLPDLQLTAQKLADWLTAEHICRTDAAVARCLAALQA